MLNNNVRCAYFCQLCSLNPKWEMCLAIMYATFMHIYFCCEKRKWKLDRKCMIYVILKLFLIILFYQTLLLLQFIEFRCMFRAGICAFCFRLLRFLLRSPIVPLRIRVMLEFILFHFITNSNHMGTI